MNIQSMTGYGIGTVKDNEITCIAELKSLNSKVFDFKLWIDDNLQLFEPKIKSFVQDKLKRGRTTLNIKLSSDTQFCNININDKIINQYINSIKNIKNDFVLNDNNILFLLRFPEVVEKNNSIDNPEKLQNIILSAVSKAIDNCINMRITEGKHTAEVLLKEIQNISEKINIIKKNKDKIIKKLRDNFNQKITDLLNFTVTEEIEKRIILEVAFYIEKSDISEEISRLDSHVKQFNDTIMSEKENQKGKKLNFLMQEFLRETNTISSKSNDIEISTNCIEIKNSIEKIKEQLFNIL